MFSNDHEIRYDHQQLRQDEMHREAEHQRLVREARAANRDEKRQRTQETVNRFARVLSLFL